MYAQDYDETFPTPGGIGGASAAWDNVDNYGVSLTLDTYLKNRGKATVSIWCCPDLASTANWGAGGPPAPGSSVYFYTFPRSFGMNQYLRAPGTTVNAAKVVVSDPDAYNPAAFGPSGYKTLNYLPSGIALAGISTPASTDLLYEGIPEQTNDKYNGYVGRAGDWTSVGGYYKTAAACAGFIGFGATCQTPGLTAWHNGMDNFVYCDGHVKAHKPVQQGWTPTTNDPGDFLVTHCRGNAPCP